VSIESLTIVIDDLSGPEVAELLGGHVQEMASVSPPGSSHALDLEALRRPEITFWSARAGGALAGCGALKELAADHGEIKSMRTAPGHQKRGVASRLLVHIIDVAVERGYSRLSLETGSFEFFAPARALYAKYGFKPCAPFAQYREDPHSAFMTKMLSR
jgi:putative acetyltransferase